MRKYYQKLILELIESLREANGEIKKLSKTNDLGSMINLLADCQESAEQIGRFIETLDVDGTKTISLLEEYYELLYQVSAEAENRKQLIEELSRQVAKIENSIKTELKPNKFEIVFFPYKASMWDCMESVWLAAKDDPDCDAYVVPIPYYDRLPDGKLGQMHYEGSEYPEYVPVVNWQGYNAEERHPDVIVIHNPYDGNNYITSVHPDFYAERLKEHTDLLVYIPYFVTGEDIEEQFCITPGTMHADKVIIESERIRQKYIRVFNEFEKNNNCKGKFGKIEEKFVALGSPKFDKVVNTKRDECRLPDEWAKLISGKKVVLYNTTVGAILGGNEQYLKKLRLVLNTFRERDDVVLWWRPHPLSESTFRSMRPQLAVEYRQIVEEYKRGGTGYGGFAQSGCGE